MPLKPGIGSASLEALVGQVADDFLTRQERGERPDIEEYAAAHPEAAEEVQNALRLLVAIGTPPGEGDEEPLLRGTLGDFRILREVGRGGMGIVYEAWQISLDRQVALKVLPFAATMDERQLQRFKNEARAVASLHHEHIVPVFAVGCERGMHFYAMQFIDGLTLAQVIARHKAAGEPTTPYVAGATDSTARPAATQVPRDKAYFRKAAEWGAQAAAALEYAHRTGVVHRDIKPANLMLDGADKLWVADFGLARTADSNLTISGDLVGTLRYMSPEQAMARHGLVDPRTDIYSLGATLYELLTGQPVLTGQDRQELFRQIAFEEPAAPRKVNRHVPAELETIVLKCLEKNPADRFVTAREVADDLRRWLDDRPILARPPSWGKRVKRLLRRHWAVASTAAVGLLLAVSVLAGSIGWAAGEQRARRAETGRVVAAALEDTRGWLKKDRPYEALSAALRAEGMLRQAGGHPELQPRVDQVLREVNLLLRLEQARLSFASGVRDNTFDNAAADEEYERAFKEFGLDVLVLDPAELVGSFKEPTVRVALAGFLEHWSILRRTARGQGDHGWRRVMEVARLVDPDEIHDRFRKAYLRGDRTGFTSLIQSAKMNSAPIRVAALATLVLNRSSSSEQVVDLLRRAQQSRPDDFWINQCLAQALTNLNPPQLEEAIGFYRAAVALRPQSPSAHYNLGIALARKGKADEAIACYREAVRIQPDLAQAHTNLGVALARKGKADEAIACYREAVRIQPDLAQAHTNLGIALSDKGKADEAIACFREAIRVKPDYAEAHTNLGNALSDKGKVDEAIACFREAIRVKPDYAPGHYNLGIALARKGKADEAIACYREAVRIQPDHAEAHTNLGVALSDKGKLDEAIACYLEAIRIQPDLAQAHYNLGNALSDKGKADEAIACYRVAICVKPDYALGHYNLGIALRAKGKLDEAIACYREAIRIQPDLAQAHYNLGIALRAKGKVDEAIACYRVAICVKPDFAEAHTNLGAALSDKGKLDEAIACYREAIRIQPDLAQAHYNLGNALRAKGKVDEAIACYRVAICVKPDYAEAHTNLGNALSDKGKVDEAIACHREAIRLKPDYALAHTNLGVALARKGKADEAIACYREAVRIQPDLAQAHYNLGIALARKGKADEAIACYREAIRVKPDYAEAHTNLGNALARKGKADEAIACYREAVRIQPDYAQAHYNFGNVLSDKGKADEAIACFREAIRVKPDFAPGHYNLGVVLARKGKLDEAIACYREAIRVKPDDAEAHTNLGAVLRTQGRFEEALAAYRRGHKLGVKRDSWPYPSAQWVRLGERLVTLDKKLSGVLAGQQQPADTTERLALAQLCQQYKRLYLTSARLYAEAFDANPSLRETPPHRYNAACAAALAGCGKGEDASRLSEAERNAWRRQALTWLSADLSHLSKQVQEGPASARQQARATLAHWQKNADLAGVRDQKALALLLAEEAQAWRKFWADVNALGPREAPPPR